MNVIVNGQTFSLNISEQASANVQDLLNQFAPKPPFAVALNGEFVAQQDYVDTALTLNDKIDVVSPIFGG